MKGFTIWQPWASLIMIGAKPYEFRGRSYLGYIAAPKIGDRIVIAAGARPVRPVEVAALLAQCRDGGAHTGLIVERAVPLLERLLDAHKCRGVVPVGHALGTARLGKPRNAGELFGRGLPHDSDCGDFNWAWPLEEVIEWRPPVPLRGAQGFFQVPDELVLRMEAA